MNKQEALALLTLAAQFDSTILPATEDDQVAKAAVWGQALAYVPFAVACEAVSRHYAKSEASITIAALNSYAEREEGGETQVTIPKALPECRGCGQPFQRSFAESMPESARCVGCGHPLVLGAAPSVNADKGFRQFHTCRDCGRTNQVGKHAFCVCGAVLPKKQEHGAMPEFPKREHLDDPVSFGTVVEETRSALAATRKESVDGPLSRDDLIRLRAMARAQAEKRGERFDADAWRGPSGEVIPERVPS